MSKRTKWAVSARGLVVAAGLASASVSSWALSQTVQSDYVYARLITGSGSPNWAMAVQGPQLNWSCPADGDCSFAGALNVSVVIKPIAGQFVPSDTLYLGSTGMRLTIANGDASPYAPVGPVALIDPNGHNHGYYMTDLGQWTFAASGTLSKAGSPLFMTAYGNNTTSLTDVDGKVYGGQKQLLDDSVTKVTANYGSGVSGQSMQPEFNKFQINQSLITPYFAYPSTTNPRCKDLSCLDYAAGIYTPDAYVFTFSLVSVPAPAVPEPNAAMLALAGLGALAYAARRRKA